MNSKIKVIKEGVAVLSNDPEWNATYMLKNEILVKIILT